MGKQASFVILFDELSLDFPSCPVCCYALNKYGYWVFIYIYKSKPLQLKYPNKLQELRRGNGVRKGSKRMLFNDAVKKVTVGQSAKSLVSRLTPATGPVNKNFIN